MQLKHKISDLESIPDAQAKPVADVGVTVQQ